MIPCIIVGIVSDSRGAEFSSPGSELQNHFRNEVFPLIEDNYRTDGFRAIVGHSWGGNFIASTLFSDQKDLFDAYIGISPSFSDDIIDNAAKTLQSGEEMKKYLYLSHGDVGRRELDFERNVNAIDSLVKLYPNKTFAWQARLIERVDHWQIVGPSISDAMISMSRNYFADQKVIEDLAEESKENLKSRLDEYNNSRKSLFGYVHEASAGYLNFVANDFRDMDDYQVALDVYKMALDKSPENVKIYVNLSDMHHKMGHRTDAKAAFQKTLGLLEQKKDKLSEDYYSDIKNWINEKLEEYD